MLKILKENKKLITIIVVVFAIIIGMVLLIRDRIVFDRTEEEEFAEYYAEETIRPRNLGELYGYSGSNELNDLYMSMNSFVSYMPKLKAKTEGMSDEELKEFFITNEIQISAYTGISDEAEFIEFIKYIKEYKVEEEFKYAEVVAKSSYKKNNYYWAEILFHYGENDEKISFHVGLAIKPNNKKLVRYSIKSMDDTQERFERNENLIQQLKENDRPGGNAEY